MDAPSETNGRMNAFAPCNPPLKPPTDGRRRPAPSPIPVPSPNGLSAPKPLLIPEVIAWPMPFSDVAGEAGDRLRGGLDAFEDPGGERLVHVLDAGDDALDELRAEVLDDLPAFSACVLTSVLIALNAPPTASLAPLQALLQSPESRPLMRRTMPRMVCQRPSKIGPIAARSV
jgi:hypothetical protein